MRKLMAVLMLAGMVRVASAEALIPPGTLSAFWYKPQASLTTFDGDVAGTAGGAIGLAQAHTFYWGIGYYGLIGSVEVGESEAEIGSFDLWYTGLELAYAFAPKQVVHGALNLFLGGGSVDAEYDGGDTDSAGIFVAEPQAQMLVNISTEVELGFGAGYRIVSGSPEGVDDSDLSGLTGTVFLRYTDPR